MQLAQCQEDSYQQAMNVRVRSCAPIADGFLVETDGSILFPGGGGQPEDYGWLNNVPVRPATSPDKDLYRFVADEQVSVGQVEMRVDWERRFDHMQQHTAQHIITAMALRDFGWNTLSFHLNPDRSDVVLDQASIGWPELRALEDRVNTAIRDARPVSAQSMKLAEVEASGARYRRLPQGAHKELRVVAVEGVDLNPCGGTHVRNTSELQLVRFVALSQERGVQARVHFLAGQRALRYGRTLAEHADGMKALLSCGMEEQQASVSKLLAREKALGRHVRALEIEVASRLFEMECGGVEPVVGVMRVKASSEFVNTLASLLEASGTPKVLIVTIGEPGEGSFCVLGPEERLAVVGPAVCSALEGRGGGRGRRFQGRAKRPDLIERAIDAAQEALGSI